MPNISRQEAEELIQQGKHLKTLCAGRIDNYKKYYEIEKLSLHHRTGISLIKKMKLDKLGQEGLCKVSYYKKS